MCQFILFIVDFLFLYSSKFFFFLFENSVRSYLSLVLLTLGWDNNKKKYLVEDLLFTFCLYQNKQKERISIRISCEELKMFIWNISDYYCLNQEFTVPDTFLIQLQLNENLWHQSKLFVLNNKKMFHIGDLSVTKIPNIAPG